MSVNRPPLSADEQAVLDLYRDYEICPLGTAHISFVGQLERELSEWVGEPVTLLIVRKRPGTPTGKEPG